MLNLKILIKTVFGAAAFLLFLGVASCKQENKAEDPKEVAEDENEVKFDDNEAREDDSEFLVDFAESDMMEIDLGKLAQSKATHAEVRKFADMMVADHTKSANEMKPLAQRLKVTLPAATTQDAVEERNALNDKTGKDFDQKYMSMMVDAHEEAIRDFEKSS